MKTEKVKVGENVRKDLGDLKELEASIKSHGILVPLIVDEMGNLISGHRRLQAAKNAGLEDVPVVTAMRTTAMTQREIQLIENIHRKDLDPLDEAEAYSAYMKERKVDVGEMGTRINKTGDYVARRLALLNTETSVRDALKSGKIEIGHAQLLSQMNAGQQKEALKNILDYDLTVQNFADQVRWMRKLDFGDIKFRPSKEGGQKSLLDSIGSELDPKNSVDSFGDTLRGSNVFKKELADYVDGQRKILRSKGIKVFACPEDLKKEYPEAVSIPSWGDESEKAIKALPGSKSYAVVVDLSYDDISKTVFRLVPKSAAPKPDEKTMTPTQLKDAKKVQAEREDMLEQTRGERIKSRVAEYRRALYLKELPKFAEKLCFKAQKVFVLWAMLQGNTGSWEMKKSVKSIAGMEEEKINAQMLKSAMGAIDQMDDEDLTEAMAFVDFDLKRDWKIDRDYLEMHTVEQLHGLAKELGLKSDKDKKLSLVEDLMQKVKTGMVPKLMRRGS
jgi:ParB/RepB/Spo0J family partition protein